MSEHQDPVRGALRQLRDEIRDAVTPPPAAGLRARATRQLRVRRTAAVAVAAAVVAAIVLSGATLLGSNAAPPAPPAGSPTASPSPSLSPSPSPDPSPSELDDPITDVDWQTATIDVPPRDTPGICPEGPVEFAPYTDGGPTGARGPQDEFPTMVYYAAGIAYGDLTGDGRAEAVLEGFCTTGPEGLTSGHGGLLLVVARGEDGTLTGLEWVGPDGAAFWDWWVEGGQLLVHADPWTGSADPEEQFIPVPGLALAYEWDGDGFAGWEPAEAYPPMVPLEPDQPGPPVQPGPVATELDCPDQELRFTLGDSNHGSATAGGATYAIEPPIQQQLLYDLNGTGDRLLLTALACERPDGSTAQGLAVFRRDGGGWQGVTLVPAPGPRYVASSWYPEGDRFSVNWSIVNGDSQGADYRWNGSEFIDE